MRQTPPTITPGILYHNADKMIDWLCDVFGFERKLVVPDNEGNILHAHLVFGNGGIMLSSAEIYEHPELCKSPKQVMDGTGTAEIIVQVEKIEAHYETAKEHNVNIIIPLENKTYGGKGYVCKDPEGHVWSFMSYDPWEVVN